MRRRWCRRRRVCSSSRLVAIVVHAVFDEGPLQVELLAYPRAPPAGAAPGSLTREREEAFGGTLAGGWIGEADQLLAQHGVDRGALFCSAHARALQNVLVDRDGEISHEISVTRDQCRLGSCRGAPGCLRIVVTPAQSETRAAKNGLPNEESPAFAGLSQTSREARAYLMNSTSLYFGSGHRSSATIFSSLSATSRTLSIAGITLSRMKTAHTAGVESSWLSGRLMSSSALIAVTNSPTRPSVSVIRSATPASRSRARWRSAAGSSSVRAIAAAVSASMLSFTAYCSVKTS